MSRNIQLAFPFKLRILPLVLILFCFNSVYGQKAPKSVYLELGGSAGLGSLNLETPLLNKHIKQLSFRVGVSLAPIDKNNGKILILPVMVHYLIGKSKHQLDIGLGQGLSLTTKGNYFILGTTELGYRFNAKNQRWFYRFSYTPLVSYLVDFQWQHWGGISIGRKF